MTPFGLFGIDNDGIGVVINLLVIFLIAIDIALIVWTYSDARRRLVDPVLIGSAVAAAVIFPFAGALVYAIVRPPETLDDAYERELDVRAAELRVRLLESAVKGGPGSSSHAASVAGELSGEPTTRRQQQAQPRSGSTPPPKSGSPRRTPEQPKAPEPGPSRERPARSDAPTGQPARRPQAPGADRA